MPKNLITRSIILRIGTAAVVVCAAAARGGEVTAEPTVRPRLPAAPVTSHDGTLVVGAATETADFRLPVLTFVGEFRAELMRATGLQFGSRKRPVIVSLGRAHGEKGAALSRVRDVHGRLRQQVEVPDPDQVDLDELRVVLARAFVRDWLVETGGEGPAAGGAEPPEWLLRGLARRQVRESRMLDFEQTYRLWSRGRLPLLVDLLGSDSVAAREPAVASVLAGYVCEGGAAAERLRTLLTPLATGGVWRAASVLKLLEPSGDAVAGERAWDAWLLAGGRTVMVPGVTPPGALRRFCSQLRLYPADVAAPVADGWRGIGPEALMAVADQPWARLLAARKQHQVRVAAFGRDGTLLGIAEAYAAFFDCLATRGPSEQAAVLLQAAHIRLRDAAQQAAAGKILSVSPK